MYAWNVAGRALRGFLPTKGILWLARDVRGIEEPTQNVPGSGPTANMQQECRKPAARRARVLTFDPELADDPPARRQPREVLQRAWVLPEAARTALETWAAVEGWQQWGKRHPWLRMCGRWFREYGREHRGSPEGILRQSAFPLRAGERGMCEQSCQRRVFRKTNQSSRYNFLINVFIIFSRNRLCEKIVNQSHWDPIFHYLINLWLSWCFTQWASSVT